MASRAPASPATHTRRTNATRGSHGSHAKPAQPPPNGKTPNGRASKTPYLVRPPTAVLTRGFDPRLSVGSARPAVFRSSTYVFSSPEAAERAFAVALGKSRPSENENVDLIYSRLS